jgi:acetyl-CoA synthetase
MGRMILVEQRKQWTALDYRTYKEAKKRFRWNERWDMFDGTRERFNIAHECIDRHPKDHTAIRIKFENGKTETYTFGEMSQWTSQFANLLVRLGIGEGERVAILLQPTVEFYVSMFGIFKRGAVVVPCSPLFGSEAVGFRLEKSDAKAIVTSKEQQKLVAPELVRKLDLRFILIEELMEDLNRESPSFTVKTTANTLAMMQFSSGTTGAPKSVKYRHGAITVGAVTMKFGNGITADDIYFCPSSPAWGHGIWYGTISPLIFGISIGTVSGKFSAEKALEALEEWGVTNMAAISSHYRLIFGSEVGANFNLKLKKMCYTGEPMPKEVMETIYQRFGRYPYVQYGSTETGTITLDFLGFQDYKVKPGSLGKPMVGGLKVAVFDEKGNQLPPGEVGQIGISRNNEWTMVGDSAYVDEDGYFWYISRIDDVIISRGYTIGPIEVEEALNKYPAVEESAVVGSPDNDGVDLVKAFVRLKQGWGASDELKEEIMMFVKTKLSKHEYPKEIEFIEELPKTPDGKIKRKELKQKESYKKRNVP